MADNSNRGDWVFGGTCSLKTWRDFYRVGLLAIEGYAPLVKLTLDAITMNGSQSLQAIGKPGACKLLV